MTAFTLTPLSGTAKPFHQQVQDLERPYMHITPEQYAVLEAGDHDFFETGDGKVVTFGTADGGYALMPLNRRAASEVRAGVYSA